MGNKRALLQSHLHAYAVRLHASSELAFGLIPDLACKDWHNLSSSLRTLQVVQIESEPSLAKSVVDLVLGSTHSSQGVCGHQRANDERDCQCTLKVNVKLPPDRQGFAIIKDTQPFPMRAQSMQAESVSQFLHKARVKLDCVIRFAPPVGDECMVRICAVHNWQYARKACHKLMSRDDLHARCKGICRTCFEVPGQRIQLRSIGQTRLHKTRVLACLTGI